MPRKIFLVACEASGDTHGSCLIAELSRLNSSLKFRGLGGPQMKAAGLELLRDMTALSALGLGDVLRLYFTYRKIFFETLTAIRDWAPDLVVVIDSPAFNLRLAKKISKQCPVIYYISPQIWAWGGRRIHAIKKHITEMLCILPFETDLYQKAKVPCKFVGHPLLDELNLETSQDELKKKYAVPQSATAIGLLPGSRESEVRRIFPIMLESAALIQRQIPQAVFYLRESPNIPKSAYDTLLSKAGLPPVRRFDKFRHDLMGALDFALVTSGTATLETALMGTPFFLLYKASWSTYLLGKHLIRVPYLGLVNLLADKPVVPEFIQGDAKPVTIAHEAEVLLKNRALYEKMKSEFTLIREKLGSTGASRRAAEAILKHLKG